MLKRLKGLATKIRNGFRYIPFWALCMLLPIHGKRIVVSNYYGRGYGDNAKYIVDELLNQGLQIVWLVKNPDEQSMLPSEVVACDIHSFKAIYYLATAKVWIDNCRKPYIFYKRKQQFYIQTWHGGGAQKKVEKDVEHVLSKGYIQAAKKDGASIDLMLSDSRFSTKMFYRAFWYDGPVLECGYPRYDILLRNDEHIIEKVYSYYGIAREKKLVLYAPTFRADLSFDAYNVDFQRLIKNLKKRFKEEYVVLVHLHPNIANKEGLIEYDGINVINSTFYPDTQELVAAAAILLGDYSSINYDFCLRRLPVVRYVTDLDAYRNDRDLYFSFEEYPYPYAKSNDELEELILNFNYEEYIRKLDSFLIMIGAVAEKNSAQKIARIILDYISKGSKAEFWEKNKGEFVTKDTM